jgi:hypothetical protein
MTSGNIDSCTAVLFVIDEIKPEVTCKPATVYLDNSGFATVDVADINGGTSDNCAVTKIELLQTFVTCGAVPSTQLELAAFDKQGNRSTCRATVTVLDTLIPDLSCPSNIVTDNSPAACSSPVVYTVPSVGGGDNCGTVQVTQIAGLGAGGVFPVGTTTETWVGTDQNGNSDTCSFNVRVRDNEKPTVICQNPTIYVDSFGTATLNVTEVDNGSNDNCGIDSLWLSRTSFDCDDVNSRNITSKLYAQDVNGFIDSCAASISVRDTIFPVLVCKSATVYLNDNGVGKLESNDIVVSTSDNCGRVSRNLLTETFTCRDLDSTTATMWVYDHVGNRSECYPTIYVLDTLPPELLGCPRSQIKYASDTVCGATAGYGKPSGPDNCAFTLSVSQIGGLGSGATFPIGITTETWVGLDDYNNADTCRFTVTVVDTVSPSVICQNPTIYVDSFGMATLDVNEVNNGSSDNCGIDSLWLSQTSFDCDDVNSSRIRSKLYALDVNGNIDSCTATISVRDTIAPVIVCKDATVYLDDRGVGSLNANDIVVSTSDNCGRTLRNLITQTFLCRDLDVATATLWVFDNSGNRSICNPTITVLDTLPPELLGCPGNEIEYASDTACGAVITYRKPGGPDNCATVSVTQIEGLGSGAIFPIGTTTETWVGFDNYNNTDTCSFTVTVRDTVKPVGVCVSPVVYLDGNGQAVLTANDIGQGSTDNCGIDSLTLDKTNFDCTDIGKDTLTLTLFDPNGNSSSCTSIIQIQDSVAPTVICQTPTVYLDSFGVGTLDVSEVDNGSTDNCGIDSLWLSKTVFECDDVFVLQDLKTTLYATDASDNIDSCTVIIDLLDLIAPIAVCNNISVYLDANGNASITEGDIDGGTTDNCSLDFIELDRNRFSCSDLGDNVVFLDALDLDENGSSCSATVTVIDTTAPTAVCQNVTVYLDDNGLATIEAGDIDKGSVDNCSIDTMYLDTSTFDCSETGDQSIYLFVLDPSRNSDFCTATITVLDTVLPTARCQNPTIYIDSFGKAGLTVLEVENSSSDNCGIDSLYLDSTSFDCSELGINTVQLTVVDTSMNSSSCAASVTVLDTIAPMAACQAATVYLDSAGNGSITAMMIENGSTDNCAIDSLNLSKTTIDCADLWSNSVVLTVFDRSGNSDTCSQIIQVLDSIAPIVSCQNTSIYLNASGTAILDTADVMVSATDNCGVDTVYLSKTLFTCLDTGDVPTVLYALDESGNEDSCTAIITVLDTIPPLIICPSDIVASTDSNACSTTVNYDLPLVSDNCALQVGELTTTFAQNNSANGSMFDIVTTNTIVIDSFRGSFRDITDNVDSTTTVEVYYNVSFG